MEVDYAFLADHAEAVNGKLYMVGGGVTILWRQQYPAPIDVAVVVHLVYNAAEAGRDRQLRLQVNDADGKALIPPLDASFTPQGRAPGVPIEAPLGALLAVRIAGAPILPKPGPYAVEVLIDGNHVRSIPFVVAIPGAQ